MFSRFFKLCVVALIVLSFSVVTVAKEYTIKIEKEEDDGSLVEIYNSPTISLSYGFSKTRLKDSKLSIADPGLAEIKLGFSSKEPEFEPESIFKYDYVYFSVTNMSTDLRGESNSDGIETDLWRLGMGREDGYGYGMGKSSITLYNASGFGWSELKLKREKYYEKFYPLGSVLLSLWEDSFRFGIRREGGVKIQVIPLMSFDAGYERAVVFSRFVFWEALLSMALEDGVHFLLDKFIDQIGDSSPYALPIVSFCLKNGLSYGIYELRKDKMNWPFDSAPPLCSDSFKFGVTFVF